MTNSWFKMAMGTALSLAVVGAAAPARAQHDNAAKQQHEAIGIAASPEMSGGAPGSNAPWFREGGLGLFIHWGISSVEAKHEISWAMMGKLSWNPEPIAPNDYFRLADQFNPRKYEPEKWLRAAKDAGFGYAVLTARHHDGYALWPSRFGDFSTRTHMGGRDLLRPYVEACRKVGLKVGFYYSPPDWYYNRHYRSFGYASKGTPESPHLGLALEPIELPEKPPGFEDQYVGYVNGQITELLTQYGKIDVLWFDGSAGPKVLSQENIRAMQPGILINDRQHGKGDFETAHSEGDLPKTRPTACWEHCFTMVGGWGYLSSEPCLPTATLLSRLVKCRAWGGNLLVNFAPRPTGEMPDVFYRCMKELQGWMATHRESVIGVEAGPYPRQSNVPVTVRGKTWFLHLTPRKADDPSAFEGPVALTGVGKPRRVAMLGTAQILDFRQDGTSLVIPVPKEARTSLVDVIAVEW